MISKNKKSFAVKITVLLLCLYGIINLVSNYIYSFYITTTSSGFFDIFPSSGFNTFSEIGFMLISIPLLLLFIAALIIWKGGRFGKWVSIILFVLSFPVAISGLNYLVLNIPKLFTQDLLYVTTNPSVSTWNLGNLYTHTNSLLVYRVIVIKSFLKSMIEIITCGFLFFLVKDY